MEYKQLPFKFGERVQNTGASDDNPLKRGFFVRYGHRSGKLNPGQFVEMTNGEGHFWRCRPDLVQHDLSD